MPFADVSQASEGQWDAGGQFHAPGAVLLGEYALGCEEIQDHDPFDGDAGLIPDGSGNEFGLAGEGPC